MNYIKRDWIFFVLYLIFGLGIVIGVVLVGMRGLAPVQQFSPLAAPTPQPCQCWCVALPIVASNQPTATITLEPTATPVYANNVLLLFPSRSTISVGDSVTLNVYVKARAAMFELRFYYSPTILTGGEIVGLLPCSVTAVHAQPGVVGYDCELLQEVDIDGNILQLSFTGNMTGTALIEPYANGAFVGFENGAAMWLAGEGAEVEVR
jgi:hypothetical protein